jgi:hypothetical protein
MTSQTVNMFTNKTSYHYYVMDASMIMITMHFYKILKIPKLENIFMKTIFINAEK